MKHIHKVALLVMVACTVAAPPSVRHYDTPAPADVLRATLPNGLHIVAVRTTLAPVVTTVVNYLVGSKESPPDFPGMAHAREHMMFRGSPGMSAEQLFEIAAAMGGRFNAVTRPTVTQYFFTVPREDVDVVLRMEALRMRAALDAEDGWEKERRAILEEVAQNLSNPDYLLYQRVLASLFEESPYEHDVLGTAESFGRTSAAMVQSFHRAWYAPNNAIVVVVGDIEPTELVARVRALFGDIQAKELPRKTKLRFSPVRKARIELKTGRPHSEISVWFRFPGIESDDFAAARVLSRILSSQRGRLNDLVSQGKALTAEFSLEALPGASIGCARVTFRSGTDASALETEVKEALVDVRRNRAPEDLVEAAKRHLVLEDEMERSSVLGLATAWSRTVAIGRKASPEEEVRALARVTPTDIARIARERLDLDLSVLGVLAPERAGRPHPTPLRTDASPVEATTPSVTLPDWATAVFSHTLAAGPSIPLSITSLANGLQLIVGRASTHSRAVIVMGRVKTESGLDVPRGKEGVGTVLDRLFPFGTTSLDRSAFRHALDEIGAQESAGTDFSLRVHADHFTRGVELLADHLLRPVLREEAFRAVRQQVSDALTDQLTTPEYLAVRALRTALLPPDDLGLREATPETVASLSLTDVRAYYDRVFRPDETKIVVIGNVDPRHVRKLFDRFFERWREDRPKKGPGLGSLPLNKASVAAIPDPTRGHASVTLAQTLGVGHSDPDRYSLEVGNHILSSALNASRLYRALRDSSGLAYRISSDLSVRRRRSFYTIHLACDPRNTSRAVATVVHELERMQMTLVAPVELARARALLLREHTLAESSIEEIARRLLDRASEGLPLDESREAVNRYSSVTAEQVRAAFARRVRPRGLAVVVHGPGQGGLESPRTQLQTGEPEFEPISVW